MIEHHFEDGDIVRLKTGGENMVVDSVDDDHSGCDCSWVKGTERSKMHFASELLAPVLATMPTSSEPQVDRQTGLAPRRIGFSMFSS